VDGIPIQAGPAIYLMMNKPRGLVTTASDEKERETIYSLLQGVEESARWVAPVGRLDKASEGLLLLTNDSEWGARVAAPQTHLDKTYHVQVDRVADDTLIQAITRGVRTPEGEVLPVRRCRLLRQGEKNSWLEIVLDEGKNRQIRRMLTGVQVEVLRLVRVAIGPLELGKLGKGSCRALTKEEKLSLDRAMTSRSQR